MAQGFKTGGRQKGSLNKENRALRDMILQALDEQEGGGVEYLKRQALDSPSTFMTILGKVLPTQISNDGDDDFRIALTRIERAVVDPAK